MQISIIVKGEDNRVLNDYLSKGYTLAAVCPMPSSLTGDGYAHSQPQCLVVLNSPKKE